MEFKREDQFDIGSQIQWDGHTLTKTKQVQGEETANEWESVWKDENGAQYWPMLSFEQGNSGPSFNRFAA